MDANSDESVQQAAAQISNAPALYGIINNAGVSERLLGSTFMYVYIYIYIQYTENKVQTIHTPPCRSLFVFR